MKQEKLAVKGTPILPSACGIGMAVLWYLFFYFFNGEWTFDMNTFSFSEMTGTDVYFTVLALAVPVLFFIGVLFLAELDLRWMLLPLLTPVVYQVSAFILHIKNENSEYIFQNPIKFIAPFLALILFVFTVERILPSKWIFVGFCGIAVLLPLILTLFGTGEFTFSQQIYDAEYNIVTVHAYLWSEYLSFALYYVGLGALAVQMAPSRQSEPVPSDEAPSEEASPSDETIATEGLPESDEAPSEESSSAAEEKSLFEEESSEEKFSQEDGNSLAEGESSEG